MKKYLVMRILRIFLVFSIFVFLPLYLIINRAVVLNHRPLSSDITFIVSSSDGSTQSIKCWYDETDKKCYAFLPSYANEDNSLIFFPEGVQMTIGSHIMQNGIAPTHLTDGTFPVVVYDTNGSTIEESILEIMYTNNIPALFIDTESGSMKNIHQDRSYKESGDITLITASGDVNYKGELAYIKGRGNSTWIPDKKPYILQFSDPIDLLNMGKSTSWVLLANYYDKSNIRNKIVYDTALDAGLAFSPDSRFVDLYANGEYLGLYLLSEKISVGENRVEIEDLSVATQNLNLFELNNYFPYEDTTDVISKKGFQIPNNPVDVTGGYILQIEEHQKRYEEEKSGFITKKKQNIVIHSPKYSSVEQVGYISEFIQQFEDALYAEDGISPYTGKSYTEYIDFESWAKKYLVEEIFENLDSGITSDYMHKYSDSTSPLIYAGPVWDYDFSIGNSHIVWHGVFSVKNPETFYAMREIRADIQDKIFSQWYPRLYKNREFYECLVEEYTRIFVPVLEKLIDTISVITFQYNDDIGNG